MSRIWSLQSSKDRFNQYLGYVVFNITKLSYYKDLSYWNQIMLSNNIVFWTFLNDVLSNVEH